MTYPVIVTQKAKDDLRHYFALAANHAPETAARWLNRFEEALQQSHALSASARERLGRPTCIPVLLRQTHCTVSSALHLRRETRSCSSHSTRYDDAESPHPLHRMRDRLAKMKKLASTNRQNDRCCVRNAATGLTFRRCLGEDDPALLREERQQRRFRRES